MLRKEATMVFEPILWILLPFAFARATFPSDIVLKNIRCRRPLYRPSFTSAFLPAITNNHANEIRNIRVRLCESKLKDSPTEIKTAETPPPGFISGPTDPPPDYSAIHGPLGPLLDGLFLNMFRSALIAEVGADPALISDGYPGIMELTAALNAKHSDRSEVRRASQEVLRSLFPSWLPGRFAVMFARPFPQFSARMNAWATWVAGTWLMGECEVVDCDADAGAGAGAAQGLIVRRCRFLEEAGCASVCVNACKTPTEAFFAEDMGLPLTMEPDYATGECKFSFGLTPQSGTEKAAKEVPCLMRCPTAGGMRKWHTQGVALDKTWGEEDDASDDPNLVQCSMM